MRVGTEYGRNVADDYVPPRSTQSYPQTSVAEVSSSLAESLHNRVLAWSLLTLGDRLTGQQQVSCCKLFVLACKYRLRTSVTPPSIT
jgi:hypothetical protein